MERSGSLAFNACATASGTMASPFSSTEWPGTCMRESPAKRISPLAGRSRAIAFSVVDFPAPFAPIRVTISPSCTSKEMFFTAWMLP